MNSDLAKAVANLPSMQGAGPIEKITHVRCLSDGGYHVLTAGEVYEVVEFQEGIFSNSPYIVIRGPGGRVIGAHASRFAPHYLHQSKDSL